MRIHVAMNIAAVIDDHLTITIWIVVRNLTVWMDNQVIGTSLQENMQ